MRLFKGKSEGTDVKMNMTPMIDVIFQLIIFFMCSIHFKALEGKLQTYLPKEKGIHEPDEKIKDPPPSPDEVRIHIRHNKDNPVKPHLSIGQNNMADFDSLYQEMTNIYQRYQRMNQVAIFKIDPEPEVATQFVTNVINECKKAGISPIEIAMHTPPTGPPGK